MRRCVLLVVLLALVAVPSCGRKQEAPVAPPAEEAAAVARQDKFESIKKVRGEYEKLAAAMSPDYRVLYRNATIFEQQARRVGDTEDAAFFGNEVKRVAGEIAKLGRQIIEKAEAAARAKAEGGAAPDDVWYARFEIWERCVADLEKFRETYGDAGGARSLVREASRRREQANLLHKAYIRFGIDAASAKSALENNEDPESAVAQLAIFRAWLASEGLMGSAAAASPAGEPPSEAAPREGQEPGDAVDASGLAAKLNELIAEYEKKLPKGGPGEGLKEGAEAEGGVAEGSEPGGEEDAGGAGDEGAAASAEAAAKIPWQTVAVDEFLVNFSWSSESGECTTEDDAVVADAGDGGGLIECADASWIEFIIEFQVKLEAGERFWVGARPRVASGAEQPEYRRKLKVELEGTDWRQLRIQVEKDKLVVFDVTDEKSPKAIGDPLDLLPRGGQGVRGGFMIGLEPKAKIGLKGIRFKVLSDDGEEAAGGGQEGGEEGGGEAEGAGKEKGPGKKAPEEKEGAGEKGKGSDKKGKGAEKKGPGPGAAAPE